MGGVLRNFPADFKIKSSRVEIQRQIGNAVPSHLAEILARSIAHTLTGRKPTAGMKLAVTSAATTPKPEAPQPVPAEFLHLQGSHKAHPGTGKGRSYEDPIAAFQAQRTSA